jgi:hypothetical protein
MPSTPATVPALLVAALALAGCTAGSDPLPDDRLPGVRTETTVRDDLRCGALLFPHGCVVIRAERAESGCAPEVGGYVVCNATLDWSAESGAALPGSQLVVSFNGTEAGRCVAAPGDPCRLVGNATYTHHFEGAGQADEWLVALTARLDAPGEASEAEGEFVLVLAMRVRTEGAASLAT